MEEIKRNKRIIVSSKTPEDANEYLFGHGGSRTIVIVPYGQDNILAQHEPEITKYNAEEYGLKVYFYREMENLMNIYKETRADETATRMFVVMAFDFRELNQMKFSFLQFYEEADKVPEIYIHYKALTSHLDTVSVYERLIKPIFSKSFDAGIIKDAPTRSSGYFTVQQLVDSMEHGRLSLRIKGSYGGEYGIFKINSPLLKELYNETVVSIAHHDYYKDEEVLNIDIEDTAMQLMEYDRR